MFRYLISLKPGIIYIVTAKHVLYIKDNPLREISIRYNVKDSTEIANLSLIWSGQNKNVFVHPDPSVDIAVLPVRVSGIDFIHIPVNQIIKKSDYDSLKIDVGTDVFFTGLFTAYTGVKNITPIFRFGKVCLITNEKIEFEGMERELILIESSSFGGNSGSPVIFQYRDKVGIHVSLGGVVLGSYNSVQILGKSEDQDVVAWSSMGISAVTPSEFILEILNLPELKKLRSEP